VACDVLTGNIDNVIVIIVVVIIIAKKGSDQMTIPYAAHGTARVAVVACPKFIGDRLVQLSTKGEYSWAIRDYIKGLMLRSGDSELTLSQIEADITYSEKPTYRSVNRKVEWERELEQLSIRNFGKKYDPNRAALPSTGAWKQM